MIKAYASTGNEINHVWAPYLTFTLYENDTKLSNYMFGTYYGSFNHYPPAIFYVNMIPRYYKLEVSKNNIKSSRY